MFTTRFFPYLVFVLGLLLIINIIDHGQAPSISSELGKDSLMATAEYETQAKELFQSLRGKQVQMVLSKFNSHTFGSEGGKQEQLSAKDLSINKVHIFGEII